MPDSADLGRGQGSPAGPGGPGVAGRSGRWTPRSWAAEGDNVSCYLQAYYQRIATEDLAPPARMAAVAQAHARAGPAPAAGPGAGAGPRAGGGSGPGRTPSSMVVDIVVDDMPYLVDSVTTELNRHEAEIQLLSTPSCGSAAT
jgi:glutamate dehydrogenase